MSTPPLTLNERRTRAVQLATIDEGIHESIRTVQDSAPADADAVITSLLAASQALQAEADKLWPKQAWHSTATGGPPMLGDLHVKLTSVTPGDGTVHLRIGISEIQETTDGEDAVMRVDGKRLRHGPEITLMVRLDAAGPLIDALREHAAYWAENPPNG